MKYNEWLNNNQNNTLMLFEQDISLDIRFAVMNNIWISVGLNGEKIEAPHYCHFERESTGGHWIPLITGQ